MNQLNKLNHLKKLNTLIQFMGRKDGVNIQLIDSKTKMEFTDGETVYIRNGDFDDPDYVTLTFGLAQHGAGHVKHSFTDTLPKHISMSKFALSIFNVIEDVRMERLIKQEYAGSAKHLERMVELLLVKGWLSASLDSSAKLLAAYLLYFGRFHFNNDVCLKTHVEITYQAVIEMFGQQFAENLKSHAARIGEVVSFDEGVELTNDIIHALKEETSEHHSNKKTVSGESPNDPINDALNAGDKDILPDLHDTASELLEVIADKAEDDERTDPHWLRQVVKSIPPNARYFDPVRARSLAATVKDLAKRIIYAKKQTQTTYSQKGVRLSPARYSAALAGNKNIFEQSIDNRAPFSNVQIMIDTSGTMYGTGKHVKMTACQQQRIEAQSESWMAYANETVYALASGLKSAGHHAVAVDYFWSSDTLETQTLTPYFYNACQPLGPVLPERFAISPQGTTPLQAAVDEGVFRLYSMPMPYGVTNLLILITDAKTDSANEVTESIYRAKKSGVSILLICTADECEQTHNRCYDLGLSQGEYLILSEPTQMPSLLTSLIQQRVLR